MRSKEPVALSAEAIFLLRLPSVPEASLAALRAELDAYHAAAQAAAPKMELWEFWRAHELLLPVWFAVARSVALVMTYLVYMRVDFLSSSRVQWKNTRKLA